MRVMLEEIYGNPTIRGPLTGAAYSTGSWGLLWNGAEV
jgi:hypothetical protein